MSIVPFCDLQQILVNVLLGYSQVASNILLAEYFFFETVIQNSANRRACSINGIPADILGNYDRYSVTIRLPPGRHPHGDAGRSEAAPAPRRRGSDRSLPAEAVPSHPLLPTACRKDQ